MSDGVSIDTSSFAKFARDLRAVAPELKLELLREMKQAGEIIAEDARGRANSFQRKGPGTSRIADSIKVSVSGDAIKVVANKKKAPEARVIEHGGQGGKFRHPTFGDRENWVDQDAHPFLRPAMLANREMVVAAVKRAVAKALEKVHSHA